MDSEIFDKAQAILTLRRKKAETENEERIREINEKIPQIREINEVIFNTGKELISIISNGKGKDISDKVEQLKQYNLGAQAMSRKILAEYGYPEDYLDMHYTCPKCCDRGYNGSKFCDCFKTICGKLAADELNKNSQLSLSSFDSFSLTYYSGENYSAMKKILEYTMQYAATFTPDSKSILMFGQTGLGKTHLSLAIANKVLEKGYGVIYDSAINILRSIEKEHFSHDHSSEMIDLVMDTDLLILDDLGTEYETPFYNATIYNIINTRLNRRKPSIISTNLDFSGISRRYDKRVMSRIISEYSCLEFKGEDVRLQKRKNA
ncbi:ATP-binding protein [Ruminococcus flavefaciens]|uniref:DNA replication protein DnaC n=1 Tax=Ruminococcus flavefaciens TaxID=1265 RepID=A0A315Y3X1_RUMFL|nr:ATP-binding protein [Ruminococcus flavefaciens]PWJ15371.1 DNA replication protein DnaC [Ruminococcus flavefaciens]SSA40502.1 DNA replication protein DnaC [Ruminococcus flavefaciens]